MRLVLPLKDIYVTQPFGVNWVRPGFYAQFGLSSDNHNGIDFRLRTGARIYACHDGIVKKATQTKTFGKYLVLDNVINGEGYSTVYGHCSELLKKAGETVKQGDLIALGGGTGTASSGPHLHLGYREYINRQIKDYRNGYLGYKNPAKFFKKDWEEPNAYHRYGRKREYLAEVKMRFKNRWLHRHLLKHGQIKKIYDNTFINALVYGGWDFETIINPAIQGWKWVKKEDFKNGVKAFQ